MKTRSGIIVLILFLLLSACSTPPVGEPSEIEGFADHLVISEIAAGITGNNLYDYIELYNPTNEILDLNGLSIWYQLKEDADLSPAHRLGPRNTDSSIWLLLTRLSRIRILV